MLGMAKAAHRPRGCLSNHAWGSARASCALGIQIWATVSMEVVYTAHTQLCIHSVPMVSRHSCVQHLCQPVLDTAVYSTQPYTGLYTIRENRDEEANIPEAHKGRGKACRRLPAPRWGAGH